MSSIPFNQTSSFPTTNEPTIRPQKPCDSFAGCPVWDLDSTEYNKLMRGKNKWDRWKRYFDAPELNETALGIRNYLYRNPNRTVVLRNKTTQDMVYFRPKKRGEV